MIRLESCSPRLFRLILLLIFAVCFCLSFSLEAVFFDRNARRRDPASVLAVLMGDSRRMFANHFFAKADAYFHAGFYPTIFDQSSRGSANSQMLVNNQNESHEHEHASEGKHEACEGMDFLRRPNDWVERFGRNFFQTEHVHLEDGAEREILPWLKLSAELDPQRVDTYVTAGYWLHHRLNKPQEAEQFLRLGLRANPDSYEILSQLGSIYAEHKKQPDVARRLWELALEKWQKQEAGNPTPNEFAREQILIQVVRLEQNTGDLPRLLHALEQLKQVAVQKEMIEEQIKEVKAKMASAAAVVPK